MKYPSEEALKIRQANDLMKIGLSQRHGITLVEVRAKDISFKGMQALVPTWLPRRDFEALASAINYLEGESRKYRRAMGI